MPQALCWLAFGLAVTVFGAEMLVRGSSSLARRFRVSELAIGLTVVAFGTSTPELIVNVLASIEGNAGIAYGNVLGSNIFNILLILGVAGLIRPLAAQHSTTWKEIPFSLAAALVLWLLVKDVLLRSKAEALLSRTDGVVLLVLFAAFMGYSWRLLKADTPSEAGDKEVSVSVFRCAALIALGLVALFAGGRLVVSQAIDLARLLAVSDKLVALTVVAAGTSLPELATSAVAAYRNRPDIAIGNIIGSNIFNILFILGLSGTLSPLGYSEAFDFDLAVLAVATVLLFFFMFTGKRHKLDRWEAGLFLAGYLAYTINLVANSQP